MSKPRRLKKEPSVLDRFSYALFATLLGHPFRVFMNLANSLGNPTVPFRYIFTNFSFVPKQCQTMAVSLSRIVYDAVSSSQTRLRAFNVLRSGFFVNATRGTLAFYAQLETMAFMQKLAKRSSKEDSPYLAKGKLGVGALTGAVVAMGPEAGLMRINMMKYLLEHAANSKMSAPPLQMPTIKKPMSYVGVMGGNRYMFAGYAMRDFFFLNLVNESMQEQPLYVQTAAFVLGGYVTGGIQSLVAIETNQMKGYYKYWPTAVTMPYWQQEGVVAVFRNLAYGRYTGLPAPYIEPKSLVKQVYNVVRTPCTHPMAFARMFYSMGFATVLKQCRENDISLERVLMKGGR